MSRGTLCALTAPAMSLGTFFDAEGSTVQIPGHTFKTAKNCERTAAVGKFDRKCDIPIFGWRGAESLCRALLKVPLPGSVSRKSEASLASVELRRGGWPRPARRGRSA